MAGIASSTSCHPFLGSRGAAGRLGGDDPGRMEQDEQLPRPCSETDARSAQAGIENITQNPPFFPALSVPAQLSPLRKEPSKRGQGKKPRRLGRPAWAASLAATRSWNLPGGAAIAIAARTTYYYYDLFLQLRCYSCFDCSCVLYCYRYCGC